MNKVFFLILITAFIGCASQKDLPRMGIPGIMDFRHYTSRNFMITTETYNGDYEPVGVVSYKILPEAHYQESPQTAFGSWISYPVQSNEVLDSLYLLCNKLGANAIMNFWYKRGNPYRVYQF